MVIPVHDDSPVRRLPLVTYALIAVNAAVFVTGPASGLDPLYGSPQQRGCAQQRYTQRWGAVPEELLTNRPLSPAAVPPPPAGAPHCPPAEVPGKVPALSVVTSLFVHGGWLHLLGNLLFLLVFGRDVEDRMGRLRFLAFYLGVGTVATYGYALAEIHTADATRTLIGASGAIAGVLGASLRLYPKARVTSLVPLLLFLPLRFPAWLVLGFWFAVQWWWAHSADDSDPGVAYLAHVIGFAAGFLATWALYGRARSPRQPPQSPQPAADPRRESDPDPV
ncbi:rhomboid family intramembrane serine protease [Peterkaempfera bronchialis]|uniref:Rhomboid family intramembrane serine protease n=1 Tax=Peterkaempfera bronchialis TaxID=2126346 RepID=A0A345T5H8_9ACTN|nr:rhomboid family intramembrane serine protease [Peterkaempfera bronchialis]AXI81233.1 rhomboid family intramembrane serine protease [Peterkaempfera bronchialis]